MSRLYVWGPAPATQDHVCLAGVDCTLGALTGLYMDQGDGILAVNAGRRRAARQSCGDAPDPLIGGGALYSLTAQLKVHITGSDLPRGGTFTLCFCHQSEDCTDPGNYMARVGELVVRGPSRADQDQTCTPRSHPATAPRFKL